MNQFKKTELNASAEFAKVFVKVINGIAQVAIDEEGNVRSEVVEAMVGITAGAQKIIEGGVLPESVMPAAGAERSNG